MQDKEALIDDIISMLDGAVDKGVGHLNVQVNDGKVETKEVTSFVSSDCNGEAGDMACSVPTLHEGLDAEENV